MNLCDANSDQWFYNSTSQNIVSYNSQMTGDHLKWCWYSLGNGNSVYNVDCNLLGTEKYPAENAKFVWSETGSNLEKNKIWKLDANGDKTQCMFVNQKNFKLQVGVCNDKFFGFGPSHL